MTEPTPDAVEVMADVLARRNPEGAGVSLSEMHDAGRAEYRDFAKAALQALADAGYMVMRAQGGSGGAEEPLHVVQLHGSGSGFDPDAIFEEASARCPAIMDRLGK